jgi:hypothetical protein
MQLKCNRARPCSGCVLRGTQNMCFPNYGHAEPSTSAMTQSLSSRRHGSVQSGPIDPLAELNKIQSSLSTLQRHYRNAKKHIADPPASEVALYQDVLLNSDRLEAFFAGPTYAYTDIFNHFEVCLPVFMRWVCSESFVLQGFRSRGVAIARAPGNETSSARFLRSSDLVDWLPPWVIPLIRAHLVHPLSYRNGRKPALQTLIHEYLCSATWLHRYVDEVELKRKLDAYVSSDELDELTLAIFFALSATTLHYIQWDHKIRRVWPEDSDVCVSHPPLLQTSGSRTDHLFSRPQLIAFIPSP